MLDCLKIAITKNKVKLPWVGQKAACWWIFFCSDQKSKCLEGFSPSHTPSDWDFHLVSLGSDLRLDPTFGKIWLEAGSDFWGDLAQTDHDPFPVTPCLRCCPGLGSVLSKTDPRTAHLWRTFKPSVPSNRTPWNTRDTQNTLVGHRGVWHFPCDAVFCSRFVATGIGWQGVGSVTLTQGKQTHGDKQQPREAILGHNSAKFIRGHKNARFILGHNSAKVILGHNGAKLFWDAVVLN